SRRARGLRLLGYAVLLAIIRRNGVLPSPSDHRLGDLSLWLSKLYALPVAAPFYASDRTSRCAPQDSGAGWIRCSFPVGLFHSLLHAGLSRRSVCPTWLVRCRQGMSRQDWRPQGIINLQTSNHTRRPPHMDEKERS